MANLREIAHADLRKVLSDVSGGPAWAITVIDPDNKTAPVTGLSGDISQVIDPETGLAVSGRSAHVSFMIADLAIAGLSIPESIPDSGLKPWRVSFADLQGNTHDFKISEVMPDRTLGIVTCSLEAYCP